MRVNRGRESGAPGELRGPTFTGDVWADPVLASSDGVMVNTVLFTPGVASPVALGPVTTTSGLSHHTGALCTPPSPAVDSA